MAPAVSSLASRLRLLHPPISPLLQTHSYHPTRLSVRGMSEHSSMHASADPSSSKPSGSGKAKVNWKNGPPSCKECVRLKLKVRDDATTTRPRSKHVRAVTNGQCSRSWPCTSCVRRGCEKICPTGTLAGRCVQLLPTHPSARHDCAAWAPFPRPASTSSSFGRR